MVASPHRFDIERFFGPAIPPFVRARRIELGIPSGHPCSDLFPPHRKLTLHLFGALWVLSRNIVLFRKILGQVVELDSTVIKKLEQFPVADSNPTGRSGMVVVRIMEVDCRAIESLLLSAKQPVQAQPVNRLRYVNGMDHVAQRRK